MSKPKDTDTIGTPLSDKIDEVLTECRVVIPGAQALLGFQLIAMLMEGFDKLPASSKEVHLASLLLIALSMILLMTPAAFHRIVERGENTHRFWLHTRRMLMSAMAVLAIGICGDFYVVLRKVSGSSVLACCASAVLLVVFYGAWFGYTLFTRARVARTERQPAELASALHVG